MPFNVSGPCSVPFFNACCAVGPTDCIAVDVLFAEENAPCVHLRVEGSTLDVQETRTAHCSPFILSCRDSTHDWIRTGIAGDCGVSAEIVSCLGTKAIIDINTAASVLGLSNKTRQCFKNIPVSDVRIYGPSPKGA